MEPRLAPLPRRLVCETRPSPPPALQWEAAGVVGLWVKWSFDNSAGLGAAGEAGVWVEWWFEDSAGVGVAGEAGVWVEWWFEDSARVGVAFG